MVTSEETVKNNTNTNSLSDRNSCNVDDKQGKNKLFYPPLYCHKCILPKCLQGKVFMLVLMCGAVVGQGMIVTGQLPIALSGLEKNFGYTSVQSGSIHSCYDIFFGISAIIVGLFGNKRKMFVIGIGIFIMALGCFLFTLPHFLYNYRSVNNNLIGNDQSPYIEYGVCNTSASRPIINKKSSKLGYLAIFCVAYSLIGIGAAPMHTLGLIFFDEQLKPGMSALFIGIFYLFGSVGPGIGFFLGKPFLALPVTLKDNPNSTITPNDEGWVGAWWLGYIVGGGFLLIVGILAVLFPSRLPPLRNDDPDNEYNSDDHPKNISTNRKFTLKIIDYFKSFNSLRGNIPYIILIIGMGIEGIVINGLGTFLAKIFEIQFRVNPSQASIYAGALVVFGAALGSIIGGYTINKICDTTKRKALMILIFSVFSTVCFTAFFIGSDSRKIDKIILNDAFQITGDKHTCQSACNCFSNKYEPICHIETNITYFSPCMAGCKKSIIITNETVYTDCKCLDSSEYILHKGGCKPNLGSVTWFMIAAFAALFFNFLIFVPQLTLVLQLLDEKSKNSGIGLQQIFARIGFIIGPFLYGYFLDLSCILWNKDESTNGVSYCPEYNNPKMRLYLVLCSISIKSLESLAYLVTYFLILKSQHNKNDKQLNTEQKSGRGLRDQGNYKPTLDENFNEI